MTEIEHTVEPTNLADQASANLRVEGSAEPNQRQIGDMASVYEMALALNRVSAADLDERLHVVLQQVRGMLDYDICMISLAPCAGLPSAQASPVARHRAQGPQDRPTKQVPGSEVLRVRAVAGEGAEGLLGIEFPIDHGINAWIYREGKPLLVGDADTDPRRLHIPGRTEPVRAAVGAPLIIVTPEGPQTIGTIYAGRRQPHAFTEAHLNFLTIVATHVAAAVQQVRLLDQAYRRAEEMEILQTISAVMASSLNVEQILQTIYQEGGRIMNCPSATFFAEYRSQGGVALTEWDKDAQERDSVRFGLADGGERSQAEVAGPVAWHREPAPPGLVAYVAQTGRPLLIRTAEGVTQERDRERVVGVPLPDDMGMVLGRPTQSWLGVPIVVKDEVLGVIGAQSYEPYVFTRRHLRLLSAIANQAGIALQNARLFADVQRAHRSVAEERDKLAHLHLVVADVQKADDLGAKLQIIANGMQKLGWGRVSVSLRDADLNMIDLACAGFTPEDEAALRANPLPGSEWKKRFATQFDRFRIGSCYYLPWSDAWVRENVRGVKSHMPDPAVTPAAAGPAEASGTGGVAQAGGWHPQDLLYVPLYGRENKIIGIIGLDDPQDGRGPTSQRLPIIEVFAHEAALAIENAKLLADLQLVNTDLQEMVAAQAHLLHTIEEIVTALDPEAQGLEILRLAGKEPARA